MLKADPPPATPGATQPETRYSYTPLYAYYKNSSGSIVAGPSPIDLLTGVSTCQTEAPSACPGTADEVKTTFAYGSSGVANNLLTTSIAKGAGNGSLTATTSMSYDDFGNVASITGPLGAGQTTAFFYDADRRETGFIGPNPGGSEGLAYPAVHYLYVPDGMRYETDVGTDTSQSDSSFATFTLDKKTVATFDGIDRTIQVAVDDSSGDIYKLRQYYYDNANRLTCSIVRMNSSNFGTLYMSPPSSCGLTTEGSDGNDRITQFTYDNADELTQVAVAVGDSSQADYDTKTYTSDGLVGTDEDADNNLTTYTYDGLDRLSQITYPSKTQGAGVSDSTDYEAYTYDADGNRLTARRRSGDTITYTYDALNRVTEKAVPSWSGQDVFYGYDLLNRVTAGDFGSLGGPGVSYTYDALSRKTAETAGSNTLLSQYDAAGDRTQITWPDGFYVDYVYDNLQRPTEVEEEGATSGVGLLATYTYDGLGRLTGITRGNGADTSLGYDAMDRISSLAHSFANTSANVSWSFTYDPADGVLTRTSTNDTYTSHPGALSLSYVANGLNQYSSVSGTTYSYDSRGDLTSDGSRNFSYDVDNKLLTGTAPTAATFTYDPLGRMQTDTASSTTTTFLDDGDNLSAEYNSSGTVLRRYVPSGLGDDQPLVWYEGASTTDRRWLHADNQGSIAAYSNASGDETAAYGYGPYGEPAAWSGSRYAYTGQLMIPESLLYNYKARVYDPNLGRFLQADPLGYLSDVNPYAYTRNDPLNGSDPTGMAVGDNNPDGPWDGNGTAPCGGPVGGMTYAADGDNCGGDNISGGGGGSAPGNENPPPSFRAGDSTVFQLEINMASVCKMTPAQVKQAYDQARNAHDAGSGMKAGFEFDPEPFSSTAGGFFGDVIENGDFTEAGANAAMEAYLEPGKKGIESLLRKVLPNVLKDAAGTVVNEAMAPLKAFNDLATINDQVELLRARESQFRFGGSYPCA